MALLVLRVYEKSTPCVLALPSCALCKASQSADPTEGTFAGSFFFSFCNPGILDKDSKCHNNAFHTTMCLFCHVSLPKGYTESNFPAGRICFMAKSIKCVFVCTWRDTGSALIMYGDIQRKV